MEKKLLNIKCVSWFCLQNLSEKFLTLTIDRDTIQNVYWSSRKVASFLSDFNEIWIFSIDIRTIFIYQISWKLIQWQPSSSTRTKDGRTEMTKLIDHFSYFCERALKMCSSNFDWVVPPFQMTHQFNYSSQQRSPLEDSYRSTSFVFEQKRVFWPIWFAQPPTSQIAWKALFAGRHFCLKVPTILCLLVALQMVGVFLHFFTGLHIVVLCYKNKFTVRSAFTLTAHSSSRTICMFLFETTLCCQ
jgi:hypothetical protein